ncbi:MAG TPA: hypothetical protein VGK02_09330 [Candidatus Aquicultor sp.]|jgi:uncharacterized sodium:solute symporter family permease YidK
MYFVAFVELINFLLAAAAAAVSFGILRKVASNLAASWKYSFVAFLILALAMLFTAISELGLPVLGGFDMALLANIAHFIFVAVAFLGLLRYYQILKGLCKRGT